MTATVSLVEMLNEHLESDQLQLPVFPRLAGEIQTLFEAENANIETISQKIAADQVLASQLLRVANSAFFGGLNKVGKIHDSILRLGSRQVTDLVFMITQREQYKSTDTLIRPYLDLLWKHASSCALGSKWLAEQLGYGSIAEEAFMAGLLHDIGNLLLLKVLECVSNEKKHDLELSKPVLFEVLDQMHAEQGAMLLKRWNLPELYCTVVAKHHHEEFTANDTTLLIVRLVDLACQKLGIGLHEDPAIVLAATREGEALGMSEFLAAELEIMLEDASALAAA